MILCPKCLTPNGDDAKFCFKCGGPLSNQGGASELDRTRNVVEGIDFGDREVSDSSVGSAASSMSGSSSGARKRTGTAYVPESGDSMSGSFAPDRELRAADSSSAPGGDAAAVRFPKVGLVALCFSAVALVLAVVCLVMLLAFPEVPADAYQPDRSANNKTNVLLVDLNDRTSAVNMPGRVATSDASTLQNMPSEITSGNFYALWDCEVLTMKGDSQTHLVVTMHEMNPVPGRVWVNWYNWAQWTGWKSYTPD